MDMILIHGMGRTSASMWLLKYRLKKAGHNPILFGYSSAWDSIEKTSNRLSTLISKLDTTKNYVLIGHSLGTVIIRYTLSKLINNQPKACFFIAPPTVVCSAAKRLSNFWLFKILTGSMGQLLANEQFMSMLSFPMNTTIYSGTKGPKVKWLPLGDNVNDCILTLDETRGDENTRHVLIHSTHTLIMNNNHVFQDINHYLDSV
jgi:hypothetical protein